MKIFTTGAKKVLTFTLVMLILFTQVGYSLNYTREELEAKIDEIALERGVPSVFVKAIAQVESGFEHFNSNGTPKVSRSGNIGLMQVGNSYNTFDTEKLKYDIDYNINAGIDVLLSKWNASVQNTYISSVGNMDPNILENWYFALWAYNGWVGSNNPNANSRAYQEKIYNICESYFNQPINTIDTSRLPASRSTPSRGLNVATPNNKNYANIVQYNKNDLVLINTIVNDKYIYDAPSGKAISSVNNGQMAQIIDGPKLVKGYYWYKVQVNEKLSGWIQRNYIKKIGDAKNGVYPFEDILYHWCADSVMSLYNQKLISGKTSTQFCPDDKISVEDFCALFSKVYNITSESENELRFTNKDEISPWAVSFIKALDEVGLLGFYGDEINSTASITRGEITYIIAKHIIMLEKEKFDQESAVLEVEREFDLNEAFKLSEIELPFKDIDGLADWQINNIKIVYSKGIISGENYNTFNYNGSITRAAAASVMNKLHEANNQTN